jgi:2-polyprenyl-6-methoxyphenol hydroxylase-like FAD-dependent oxidoreductase
VQVHRGVRLSGFAQDADGVTATITGDGGDQAVRAQYLVGADRAHSVVRKTLGLIFEGAAFDEQYMLGDVEVDWSLPAGYGIRAMHQTDGVTRRYASGGARVFVVRPDGYLSFVGSDAEIDVLGAHLRPTFGWLR